MKNIVCMKWGTLYGPEYVTKLFNMVSRNITDPFRFICFTDDSKGLDTEIEAHELPPIQLPADRQELGWRKLSVLNADLAGLSGPTLFLDLDLLITGSLDEFFDHKPGKFLIILNWSHPHRSIGNSSVFRFEAGLYPEILTTFESRSLDHWIEKYDIEQTFLTRELQALLEKQDQGTVEFWPETWCQSFKRHAVPGFPWRLWTAPTLPEGCKILAFHGKPHPDEAVVGIWGESIRKKIRPSPWINDFWR